jgi:hypothetical protein
MPKRDKDADSGSSSDSDSDTKRLEKKAKKALGKPERKTAKRERKLQQLALALAGNMPETERAKLQKRLARIVEKVCPS